MRAGSSLDAVRQSITVNVDQIPDGRSGTIPRAGRDLLADRRCWNRDVLGSCTVGESEMASIAV
jgi:hypothetical protein